jgi:hypothetical protein
MEYQSFPTGMHSAIGDLTLDSLAGESLFLA